MHSLDMSFKSILSCVFSIAMRTWIVNLLVDSIHMAVFVPPGFELAEAKDTEVSAHLGAIGFSGMLMLLGNDIVKLGRR